MDEDGTDVTSSFTFEGMGYKSVGVPAGTHSVVQDENGNLVFPYGTKKIDLWAETNVEQVNENTLYSRRVFNLPVDKVEELMLNDKVTLIAYKAVQPNSANGYFGVYRADAFSAFAHPLETRYLAGVQGSTINYKIGSEFAGLNLETQGYAVTSYSVYGAEGCTTEIPEELSWDDFVATLSVVFNSKFVGTPIGSEKDYAHFTLDWSIGRPFNTPAQYKSAIDATYVGVIEADWEHKLKTEQRMIIPYILHTPIDVSRSKLKVLNVSGETTVDVTNNYEFNFTTSGGVYYDADGYFHMNGSSEDITQDSSGSIILPGNLYGGTFYARRTAVAKADGVNTCDSWVNVTPDWQSGQTSYSVIDYLITVKEGAGKKGIGFLVSDYVKGTFTGVGPYSAEITKTVGEASYTVEFGTEFASVEKPANAKISADAYGLTNCTTGEVTIADEGMVASVVVTPTTASDVSEAMLNYHLRFENDVPVGYSDWFSDVTLNANGKFEYQQNVDYTFKTVSAQG